MVLVRPRLGGGRRGGHDSWFESPVFWDLWDPFGSGTDWWDLEVDWRETDNARIFRADLPGVRKEEVMVHVEDGNRLKISGERTKEQEDKNDIWHRVERGLGSFVRRLRLPKNANLDETKCSLKNGELTVTVPKKETEENTKNVRNINVV